ncbi:hypothetical protein D3C79_1046250 [compost metagenome]
MLAALALSRAAQRVAIRSGKKCLVRENMAPRKPGTAVLGCCKPSTSPMGSMQKVRMMLGYKLLKSSTSTWW